MHTGALKDAHAILLCQHLGQPIEVAQGVELGAARAQGRDSTRVVTAQGRALQPLMRECQCAACQVTGSHGLVTAPWANNIFLGKSPLFPGAHYTGPVLVSVGLTLASTVLPLQLQNPSFSCMGAAKHFWCYVSKKHTKHI